MLPVLEYEHLMTPLFPQYPKCDDWPRLFQEKWPSELRNQQQLARRDLISNRGKVDIASSWPTVCSAHDVQLMGICNKTIFVNILCLLRHMPELLHVPQYDISMMISIWKQNWENLVTKTVVQCWACRWPIIAPAIQVDMMCYFALKPQLA